MKILNRICGVILLVIFACSSWLLYQQHIAPSEFQAEQAKGPVVYQTLLKAAENTTKFSADIYQASTYRPSDVLYQPVLNIQIGQFEKAYQLLRPLVEANNADAMFWLGFGLGRQSQSHTENHQYLGKSSLEWYQASAKAGNPYAALRLTPGSIDCQSDPKHICSKNWGTMAHQALQAKAESGDVKAAYYLFDFSKAHSLADHQRLVKIVTENAQHHYYKPLFQVIKFYEDRRYYPVQDKDKSMSNQDYDLCRNLITLAAYHNDVVAMTKYSLDSQITSTYNDMFVQSFSLSTLPKTIFWHIHSYAGGLHGEFRVQAGIGLAYAIAMDNSLGTNSYEGMFRDLLRESGDPQVSANLYDQAKTLAKQLEKEFTPVIYIDQMSRYDEYHSIL